MKKEIATLVSRVLADPDEGIFPGYGEVRQVVPLTDGSEVVFKAIDTFTRFTLLEAKAAAWQFAVLHPGTEIEFPIEFMCEESTHMGEPYNVSMEYQSLEELKSAVYLLYSGLEDSIRYRALALLLQLYMENE